MKLGRAVATGVAEERVDVVEDEVELVDEQRESAVEEVPVGR
ncbi:hypothetical protein ACSCBZ_31410 [Streptomyces niveiscabiei]|uniref:Uncharacterized protein n=1 Tax=Streptomyces niveiscabiei TaxID=164115 RepID=A0ABW9HWS4_9ACTN|nr:MULTISPECIES: hypothetical protein [Streptomyces]MDX3385061.1 hypothetical protein [Streptomyces niveiscabiei]